MKELPRISDAEWLVMETVWEISPLTANEIVDALGRRSGWSPRTIKTMLNRLVKKGALKFQAEGKRYLYRPAVSRDACIRDEGRSFLRRFFGGKVGPMLAHFVEESKLNPEQIEELRKLLERKDR